MQNAYQMEMVSFLRNVFSTFIVRFFWRKVRKISKMEKLRKYDEETVF